MPTRVTYTELKEVLGSAAADAEKLFYAEPETALIASILWAFEVHLNCREMPSTERIDAPAGRSQ